MHSVTQRSARNSAADVEFDSSRSAPSLDHVQRQISEISTLPHVAMRIIEVAQDPSSGAADLKRVVEGDPALSARVLRVVNSAAYGLETRVTALHQAISFLGFSQVRNLALTASVAEIFRQESQLGTYRRSDLWRHMVSVAVCSRLVAIRASLPQFEDAFVAGLLHDIGIILEDQHVHRFFARAINALDQFDSLCAAEREHLGFDHAQLGERIAQDWRFSAGVTAAIRYHHIPESARGEGREIVSCVAIANAICTLKDITSVGRKLVAAPLAAFRSMSFGRDDILVLATDLDQELKRNEALLQL